MLVCSQQVGMPGGTLSIQGPHRACLLPAIEDKCGDASDTATTHPPDSLTGDHGAEGQATTVTTATTASTASNAKEGG